MPKKILSDKEKIGKELFEKNICELITVTESCLKSRFIMPSLILIYANIDIMASLNRKSPNKSVKRDDFVEWTEKYILQGNDLGCSAIDIYAARCAIVHTYTTESDLSRNGRARQIVYAWGAASKNDLQKK